MVPCSDARLPSTGSLGSVPRLHRYYSSARTPCRPGEETSLPGPFLPHTEETTGSPRFLGDPSVSMPWPSTPAGRSHQAMRCNRAAFRHMNGVSPRNLVDSGAQSHGLLAPCVRFAPRVAPGPRNTRFRLLASFAGWDWIPTGSQRKGSVGCVTDYPPFPGLAWRTHVSTEPEQEQKPVQRRRTRVPFIRRESVYRSTGTLPLRSPSSARPWALERRDKGDTRPSRSPVCRSPRYHQVASLARHL